MGVPLWCALQVGSVSTHLETASGELAEKCRCLKKDAVSLQKNLSTWAVGELGVGQGVWVRYCQFVSAAMCIPGREGSGDMNKKQWVQNGEHKA